MLRGMATCRVKIRYDRMLRGVATCRVKIRYDRMLRGVATCHRGKSRYNWMLRGMATRHRGMVGDLEVIINKILHGETYCTGVITEVNLYRALEKWSLSGKSRCNADLSHKLRC